MAERGARSEKFEIQLLELGISIDEKVCNAIEKLKNGEIGFDEFSEFFREKII